LSEDVKLNAPLPQAIQRIPCFFRFNMEAQWNDVTELEYPNLNL
jgi:hypothetical protein